MALNSYGVRAKKYADMPSPMMTTHTRITRALSRRE
jgi:hypothetical protein